MLFHERQAGGIVDGRAKVPACSAQASPEGPGIKTDLSRWLCHHAVAVCSSVAGADDLACAGHVVGPAVALAVTIGVAATVAVADIVIVAVTTAGSLQQLFRRLNSCAGTLQT